MTWFDDVNRLRESAVGAFEDGHDVIDAEKEQAKKLVRKITNVNRTVPYQDQALYSIEGWSSWSAQQLERSNQQNTDIQRLREESDATRRENRKLAAELAEMKKASSPFSALFPY